MEQVLAPRFDFKPKAPNSGPTPGFDYGPGGYDPTRPNVGFSEQQGRFEIEVRGLATPTSPEARRICQEDLNEVIATFVQDRPTLERGILDPEMVPQELTQLRMANIVRARYPNLDDADQEAVRQHAVAALALTQAAKQGTLPETAATLDLDTPNTAFVDGVRRFALDMRELDVDLIDSINPFGAAYAILAKSMSEDSLRQLAAIIAARRVTMTPDEARDLARRAVRFKQERGRLPAITAADPWEKRMAEGVAYFARMKAEASPVSPDA